MYAIHVEEPGGEPSSYILPTGASTSESAMRLMLERAEEYVAEQLELAPTEDYTIAPVRVPGLYVNVFHTTKKFGPESVITFSAVAIDQVV